MKPIELSYDDLETHLKQTLVVVASAIVPGCEVKFSIEQSTDPLVAGIVGSGCETTERTRGAPAPVAPMLELGNGLWAWLGYREEWNIFAKGGHTRYRFRASGATVHFGFKGLDPKPQMFRAEWAGIIPINKEDYAFQAGNAGHPHWQFDAIEALLTSTASDRAKEFAEILNAEHEEAGIEDFTPSSVEGEEIRDVICKRSLSPVHFASAAPWWRSGVAGAHAHAPGSTREIRDWLGGTLQYVSEELGRL